MRNISNKFLILSPETEEEKNDMELMAKEWGIPYACYQRYFNRKIRYLSKILDSFFFLLFVLKSNKNAEIVILGVPCLRNRLLSIFLGKKYIMYLRCLHSNGENLPYLSDKIDHFFKKFGINNCLTNPYMAEIHFVTSPQTECFLNIRKAGNHIIDIGAVWLKNKSLRERSEKGKVYFISQAFSEHSLVEAHSDQINFVKDLSLFLQDRGIEFVIKKHPRDYFSYEGYTLFDGNADAFLNHLSKDDIIISSFSTLGFEISLLGGNVKFISLPSLQKMLNPLYIQNNVFFYENFGTDFSFLFDEKRTYSVFSNTVDIDVHKII